MTATKTQPQLKKFLISQVEAAATLSLCVRTIQSYRKKGLLKGVQVGSRWMYAPEELARFANEGTTERVHA